MGLLPQNGGVITPKPLSRREQPPGHELHVGVDHVARQRAGAALAVVDVAHGEVRARLQQHVDHGLQLCRAVALDLAAGGGAVERALVAGDQDPEVLVVGFGGEDLGLVQDPVERRVLVEVVEERAEPRLLALGASQVMGQRPADVVQHLPPHVGQQPVQDVLAGFEVVVERTLRHAGKPGDLRDRRVGVAVLAHDPGG